MSETGGVKQVNVTVNGVDLQVPEGELIVEAVKRIGLEIPVFCYHPRMKPVGMCRMCLVEVGFKQADGSVRMMPKPQAGCTLPASDGMVVLTDSEAVHRDRRGVLEFLLINHPLDCPICDRGGECPLQNNTLAYGPSTSRFLEFKRHLPKAFPLSQYVTLDLERCIQCGRCVRFTEEISGEHELAFRFRGAEMQPSTFKLLDFESKFSGNVIEICPVGALTSAKYRFRARPWDLETSKAVCTNCSNGCNVWFDHRAGKFVRINGRTHEGINEEWTCDKGKFGHDHYNSSTRLTVPLIRRDDRLMPCSWSEAYDEIGKAFLDKGSESAGLVGPGVSNEGLYLMKKLFGTVFGSKNLDHRWTKHSGTYRSDSTIEGLESKKKIFVVATDLAADLPIVYLRVRKAWAKHGASVSVISEKQTEVDLFAESSVRYEPGKSLSALKETAQLWTLDADSAVILSDSVFNGTDGQAMVDFLTGLCEKSGAELNVWATGANAMGAHLTGFTAHGEGKATWEFLDGSMKSLWIVDIDVAQFEAGRKALERAEFVVVQASHMSESLSYASVVLPMSLPAEQDGSWTNCEGRAQWMSTSVSAPGECKPAWRIFAECLLRMNPSQPYFNAKEVWAEIAQLNVFKMVDVPSVNNSSSPEQTPVKST
ncbi:MAG: NADH-quinone oxidoreductase subunit NuoG [Chthonomonadaceae bacterium]|nr:NADH-quinone oxidoreductase subunit NuoG [Chthonomonadaceae bacterium]